YSAQTGRTLLLAPDVPGGKTVTLRNQGDLTVEEYLQAIETVLGMNGVALLREGDEFLRVVPVSKARAEPMKIREYEDDIELKETGELVSQMIQLKHIEHAEARKAVEPLKHEYGTIHAFESINSMLVTDSAANVNRIMQVLAHIDQPVEAREEPHIIQIRYAKASDIKSKLEQILKDAGKDQKPSTVPRIRESGPPGVSKAKSPPGVIRARVPQIRKPGEDAATIEEQAERGIIRGEVRIIEDDRTNILIIITRPENMKFFEKIIQVLDVETAPDVVVKVFRLEYAEAKSIATMLNDLIGAASPKDEAKGTPTSSGDRGETDVKGKALTEYIERLDRKPSGQTIGGKSKIGELSKENIKILSDERTNSLIIMASKSDLVTIEEIIGDMDMMLSQVLIEAVIIQVSLDDRVQSGVDWLQRSLIAYEVEAGGGRSPLFSFAGAGGGGTLAPGNAAAMDSAAAMPARGAAGLTYYLTYFDLNLDAVLNLVASDSRTQIISSPVILTTDNKVATIDVSTEQYFYKGKKYVGTTGGDPIYEDDVERKKVGIVLEVTPRINERKVVVMEIKQTVENVSGQQTIGDTQWPIVTSRKMEASLAVQTGDTIVLGGLMDTQMDRARSKIPILGDIPFLGWPFRSSDKHKIQSEVIVFITPYVLDTPEDIMEDASNRRESTVAKGMWHQGWSRSKLAMPEDGEEPEEEAEEEIEEEVEEEAPTPSSEPLEEATGSEGEDPAEADYGIDAEVGDIELQGVTIRYEGNVAILGESGSTD
ncbi:type II secretion system secretin GspD, partial [Verrucomicrobiota bacterium]